MLVLTRVLLAIYLSKAMDKSVQQLMDERMCRPGYQWNDTLKRCLAAGGSANGEAVGDLPDADIEPKPGEKPGVPTQSAGGRGRRPYREA